MKLIFVAALIGLGCSYANAEQTLVIPTFVKETKTSGVHSIYAGDWQYMVGGGVATFDCNGDGFPDMFLAGGQARAHFFRNTSKQGGSLHFAEQKSGLEFDHVTGAYPIDIDSDGIMDLVVLRVGENILMRGKGNCKFERANEAWGFDGGDAWSVGFAATFEKDSAWPTLAIGNYIDRKQEAFPWGSCTDNWMHRPDASQKKFGAPTALKPSFCSLSMMFTDWNKSGTPSLRVSNDREYYKGGQEQLWHVDPGKPPALYTDKEGWKFVRIWGMGIASYDLNFDGYPEYFLSSMADSRLQSLTKVETGVAPTADFTEGAFAKGVTAHRPYTGTDQRPSTGWHTQFEDVNNDGLVDLFIAKGNVDRMPDFAQRDPNNLLLQGADGKFIEVGDKAGIAAAQRVIDLALPVLEAGQGLRFAVLPTGLDPDDLIKAQGAPAMQRVLDAAQPMVNLLWSRETEGRNFDSPERKATLDKTLRAALARIKDPSIRGHYGEEIKRLRWDLFGTRPANSNKTRKAYQLPTAQLASTRASQLANADDQPDDTLREAVILATLVIHPSLIHRFESSLERLDLIGQDHGHLRDTLLAHQSDTAAALRAALLQDANAALETLFARPHVLIAPPVRNSDDTELAMLCLAEELAKLDAHRGARKEIEDAVEDLSGLADEGLTWRLTQAALARHRADHPPREDATDLGEDRSALSKHLQNLIDGQIWVKKKG